METAASGFQELLFLGNGQELLRLLFRVVRVPDFNAVESVFGKAFNEVNVVAVARVGKNGNAAGLVDGVKNLFRFREFRQDVDVFRVLRVKQFVVKRPENAGGVAALHEGVHNMLFIDVGGTGSTVEDQFRRDGIKAGSLGNHELAGFAACKGVAAAKSFQAIRILCKITEDVDRFLIFAVISGEFHAGNDGYAVALANNFSSYGAGLTVVVCNGNGVHSAAVRKKDEIFNAERSIRETGVAM